MSGFEEPGPRADWAAFRAARDRFFAQVRPEAIKSPPVPMTVEAPEPGRPDPAADASSASANHTPIPRRRGA
jgi:hypothetical protein